MTIARVYFPHIPRTGGTTLRKWLELNRVPYHSHHTSARTWRSREPIEWDKKLTVTLVRNPWDHLRSFYTALVRPQPGSLDWEDWLEAKAPITMKFNDPIVSRNAPMQQPAWYEDMSGRRLVKLVIRTEDRIAGFQEIWKALDFKRPVKMQITHANKSNAPKPPWTVRALELARAIIDPAFAQAFFYKEPKPDPEAGAAQTGVPGEDV